MKKALIVDDSSTVRSIIAKILRDYGFDNVQAANGREAFSVLENNPDVSIAFVDWNMPVMTGIQFVSMVRADRRFSGLSLVMVTTETELPRITMAVEAGIDEYIMKPFTREIFDQKLSLLGIGAV